MKWIIASDIHGSVYYCEKLFDIYRKEGADRLLLLGDLLYHGARNDLSQGYDTKATAKLLNSMKENIMCVRGNCDSEVDQMVLEFPIQAEYALLNIGKRVIFATHGHRYNCQCPPPIRDVDILLNGHFHVPACEDMPGFIYMNPGSISLPKNNSAHSYMTLLDGHFEWKDTDGNVFLSKDIDT